MCWKMFVLKFMVHVEFVQMGEYSMMSHITFKLITSKNTDQCEKRITNQGPVNTPNKTKTLWECVTENPQDRRSKSYPAKEPSSKF